jgi:hypothetical protein
MTGTMLAVLDDVESGAGFIRAIAARAERLDARLINQTRLPVLLAR